MEEDKLNKNKILSNISGQFKKAIIQSLQSAVGDDIKLDMKINDLDTRNGNANRIWDFINRNVSKKLSYSDYIITGVTKRGSWEMKFIFDKENGILYTLMREKRFDAIRKEVSKRKTFHYVQAIADTFNDGLVGGEEQLSLFKEQYYYDKDKIKSVIDKILKDLSIPESIVRNHALILFDSNSYELESVRCCVVNSNLSIVEDENWSEYVTISDSTIMDSVKIPESKYDNPSNGLKFTQKAKDKKDQKKLPERKEKRNVNKMI